MLAAVDGNDLKKERLGALFLFILNKKQPKNVIMARKNVINFLNEIDTLIDAYGEVHIERAFYTPSYLIPLVTYLNSNPIDPNKFGVDPIHNKSYFQTVGLYKQLWDIEDQWIRINCGRTYSPIARLDSAEHVDQATSEIGSCIKSMVHQVQSVGLFRLIDVIGEVHDNVWSHGKSTGFSMAQIYKDPQLHQSFIEFTLGDQGFGFLNEMRRAGKSVASHREAIEWCIQKGHSTKHADDEDPWLQRLPFDWVGDSPLGTFGGEVSENHHQGLGLFHLIELVDKFNGELYLISGNSALHIKNKVKTYIDLSNNWQGVIISCRFDKHELLSTDFVNPIDDEKISDIIKRLRGE
jgi:hypothetical protein